MNASQQLYQWLLPGTYTGTSQATYNTAPAEIQEMDMMAPEVKDGKVSPHSPHIYFTFPPVYLHFFVAVLYV